MGRSLIITVVMTAALPAPVMAQPPPAGGSLSDRQREGIGPVDKQREGLGPEGNDIGSPATKVKPLTAPAVRQTARYSPQEVLAGARRAAELGAQVAQLAQQRSSLAAVRRLAASIARDHLAAGGHIMAYTRQNGSGQEPPTPALGPFATAVNNLEDRLRDLRSARGPMFDTGFPQLAAQTQRQILDGIHAAGESGLDPELQQILETWRASVQKDLASAQGLSADQGPPRAQPKP